MSCLSPYIGAIYSIRKYVYTNPTYLWMKNNLKPQIKWNLMMAVQKKGSNAIAHSTL